MEQPLVVGRQVSFVVGLWLQGEVNQVRKARWLEDF